MNNDLKQKIEERIKSYDETIEEHERSLIVMKARRSELKFILTNREERV